MSPQEMRALLRKEPFTPFRVHLQDGCSFDIHFPRLNLVTNQTFVIGIPDPITPDPDIAKEFVRVGWEYIHECTLLAPSATSEQG